MFSTTRKYKLQQHDNDTVRILHVGENTSYYTFYQEVINADLAVFTDSNNLWSEYCPCALPQSVLSVLSPFVSVISSRRHIHGLVNQPVIQAHPISIGKIVLPHSWLRYEPFHTRSGKAKIQEKKTLTNVNKSSKKHVWYSSLQTRNRHDNYISLSSSSPAGLTAHWQWSKTI